MVLPALLVFAFKAIAMIIIGELIRPKPKIEKPKPTALGDYQVPTSQEGRVFPVFWGTVRIKGPNCTWYGDYKPVAITQKQKTGLFSSTRVTLGYKYNLGIQLVLGHGKIDDFISLRFDDKEVTLFSKTVTTDTITFNMNQPSLFGKPKEQGGVSGPVRVYRGTYTQTQNEYLRSKVGEVEIPAYRPICYAMFEYCYFGNSGSLPKPEMDVRRTPNTLALTGGKENINGDANPACMVMEILTSQEWGMNLATSLINVATLVECAETLYDEGFGLSMIVDSEQGGENLLAEVLEQVDGVMWSDFNTGQLHMALNREDYVEADLPVFNASNIIGGTLEFSRASWEDTQNTVKIKYLDRSQNYTERVVQHQNLANISARSGQIEAEEYDYSGVSNITIANQIAAKVLRTVSSPLSRVNFEANRDGIRLRPGSPFKLQWPELGIVNIIYRVGSIEQGTLESPGIKIVAVENAFSVASVSYTAPPPSAWVNPIGPVQDLTDVKLMEAPYALYGEDRRFVMVLAAPAMGQELGYQVWADLAGGSTYIQTNDTNDLSAVGQLTAAYNRVTAVDSGFTMDTISGADDIFEDTDSEGWLILIDDELVHAASATDNLDGTVTFSTVTRGVLDTVPANHADNAKVWLLSSGFSEVNPSEPLVADGTINVKLLPFSSGEPLPIASATARSLAVINRSARPYPPGKVRIDGVAYPTTESGTVTVTWKHRNRLTQLEMIDQDEEGITPESGTRYALRLYNNSTDVLLAEVVNINAEIATFTINTALTVRLELRAVLGALESAYAHKIVFAYDPAGAPTTAITADTSATDYVLDGGGA